MQLPPLQQLHFNQGFKDTIQAMVSGHKHLLITGRAGTGKSTLLEFFRKYHPQLIQHGGKIGPLLEEAENGGTKSKNDTQSESKSVQSVPMTAVLAPTGVAALNINGETIHSFFWFKPAAGVEEVKRQARKLIHNKSKRLKLFQNLDLLIIDEISMVRADLLDCIDQFLQIVRQQDQPFGGVRLIMIGDLYQLPPVVRSSEKKDLLQIYDTEYFFSSHVMQKLINKNEAESQPDLQFIELAKIYRQTEEDFINFLNAVRNKDISSEQLKALNQRVVLADSNLSDEVITLTTTNRKAAEINQDHLQQLPGKKQLFIGSIRGDFKRSSLPTRIELELKPGSRIMMVNNDSGGRWVNGTLAKVEKIEFDQEKQEPIVKIITDDNQRAWVSPYTWTISKSVYQPKSRSIERETVGSFTQLPLRLAWAVTIHKAQGKSFDHLLVDIDRTFATGQTYVALSRATQFNNLHLSRPLRKKDIWLDWRVVKFLTQLQYQLADLKQKPQTKRELLQQAIDDQAKIRITYLKGKNIKSQRVISPQFIGKQTYAGHEFIALEAFCHLRQADRVFNLERILEAELVEE